MKSSCCSHETLGDLGFVCMLVFFQWSVYMLLQEKQVTSFLLSAYLSLRPPFSMYVKLSSLHAV